MPQIRKKRSVPFLARMLKKIAPQIGARVILEPNWKIVGQIIFKNGRKRYFRYLSVDLNSLGASEIARDKDYASFFMKRMGYPVVPHSRVFFRDDWAKAVGQPTQTIGAGFRYAKSIGFPVIVKPNSGSQGSDVALVRNRTEFYRAVQAVFATDKIVLVQNQLHGKDYRLVVLDGKIISAYERRPLSVIGDGNSTILQLLKKKQQNFISSGRDTHLVLSDPRMLEKLNYLGMTIKSVLASGERVFLLDNANLSTGGDSVDVTGQVHPDFKKIAIQLTKDMGLRLCGVDVMIDGNIEDRPKKYWILEINSAPGLDHYAASGKTQKKIVEQLYLEILKGMEKKA